MPVIILSPDFLNEAHDTTPEGAALITCVSAVTAAPAVRIAGAATIACVSSVAAAGIIAGQVTGAAVITCVSSVAADGDVDGGEFDPTDVAGLVLWAAARLIGGASNNDPIETWMDQSGEDNHLTQSSSGSRPLYKTSIINSLPALQFDGSNDHFTLPDVLSGASAGEVFIVIQIDTDPPSAGGGEQSGIWNMDGDAGSACHYCYSDGTIYDAWGSTARKTTANPTPSLTSPHIYNVSSAAGAWTNRLDGTQLHTTGSNTFSSFSGDRYLGRSRDGGSDYWLDGYIAEILIYDNVLSGGDRTTILEGLADIYGISV